MTDTRRPPTTGFLAGLALWGVWVVSALPLFALFFEFRCNELGKCEEEWWYYARFYSHYFLYPVTFGLISTALLHRPWIRTVHHLHSLPPRARTMKVGLIVVSMLLVVGFISYMEFSGSYSSDAFKNCGIKPTRAVTAPWNIAPEAMKSSNRGMRVRDLLEKRCKGTPDTSNSEGSFDDFPDSSKECEFIDLPVGTPSFLQGMLSGLCQSSSTLLTEDEKCEFLRELNALWKGGDGPRSYTEKYYRVGFVTMTILFAFLFATVFITTTRYSKSGKDPKDPETRELESSMSLLAFSLLFATFWVLMRITFLTEQLTIYPETSRMIFDWLIFMVFVVPYVHLVIRFWPKSKHYEKYLNLALSIVGVVIGVMGLLGNLLSVAWIPKVLVDVFGTGGSPETYVAVLLFLFVVHFPHLLRVVEKWGSNQDV